jgi:hypothetical protein
MPRAIDRLQLCVPFLFALSDSIGATASQCPWPGRGKRGVCHCPEGTLDRFLDGRCANRPFGDVCPLRLPLIVSEAGFELGLDARKCDQPDRGKEPCPQGRCQTVARALDQNTPSGGGNCLGSRSEAGGGRQRDRALRIAWCCRSRRSQSPKTTVYQALRSHGGGRNRDRNDRRRRLMRKVKEEQALRRVCVGPNIRNARTAPERSQHLLATRGYIDEHLSDGELNRIAVSGDSLFGMLIIPGQSA